MYAEVATALSSIKVAADLASLVLKSKVDSAVKEKATELNSAIISLQQALLTLQAQYQELLEAKKRLEQELIAKENWDAEAQKYHLAEIASGVFVRAIKEDQHGTEPRHWLCAHCYENKRKSILQRGDKGLRGWIHSCPSCKVQIEAPKISETLPEQANGKGEDDLDAPKRAILAALAEHDMLGIAKLSELLRIHQTEVKYHAEALSDISYITIGQSYMGESPPYRLEQKGREFVIKNGLLASRKL